MNAKALHLLEFPKIRERLASCTSFSAGRALALALEPSSDYQTVVAGQEACAAAVLLLELRPNFALGGVHDVRPAANQAALGGVLTPDQLLGVRDTAAGGRTARRTVEQARERLAALWRSLQLLPDCRDLELEIDRCFGPRGEVLDAASPALAHLRQRVRHAHDLLTERLRELLSSNRGRTMLQEPLITLRNGRYVVPVKAEFRGEFRGIVHDLSASGASVFMEPLETLDLGNAWRQLQLEEEREVERVLRALSTLVGDYAADLDLTVRLLAGLDLALAKAKYSRQIGGVTPHLLPPPPQPPGAHPGALRLVEARHPLLTGEVVPTSLELGGDFNILVITGPNTGGKTVALKTVGLLSLMAQAGMQVPAAGESVFPIYQDVFADIGDEQSIEQSLSTFSAHMRNIIDIVAQARPGTLVLLDELSAGTDPTEGSALARAILAELLERGVSAIATTHHSDLKAYAHNTPGLRNASVEFDNQTLSPTYRLAIGIPGRSNAIAIAQRIGLPAHLAEAARALLHPQDIQVDALLNELQRERDAAVAERRRAEDARAKAEATRQRLDERLARQEAEEEERRDAARRNLAHDIDVLKQDLERAQREIERAQREQLRDRLLAASQAVQAGEARLEAKRWRPRRRTPSQPELVPLVLTPGSRARLRGLGQEVEVVAAPDGGEVEVQLGAFRAKVKGDQLEAPEKGAGPPMEERAPASWSYLSGPAVTAEPELHLRGVRVEDALPMLEEYLDQAFRAGLPWARIVHGKGTGVMRRVVRETLAASPLVRSYESAAPEQGGEGVTVATLAL